MTTPLSVLILEDSASDSMLLVGKLKQEGYDPTYKLVDSAEALKAALARRQWDVILADDGVPSLDTLAALELLHTVRLDLPFIVVSSSIDETKIVAALKAGAHDFILKSNLTRLAPAIAREMRAADVRRQQCEAEIALREAEAKDHALGAEDLAAVHAQLELAMAQARRLEEAAKAADRAKSAFLSSASHELRTPLTGFLGGLSLVLDGLVKSPAEEHELIQLAYSAGQRLLVIVNEVLDMATLEGGLMTVDSQPVAVSPMLDEVTGLMQPLAEKKGLRLECEVADPEKMVQADPDFLRQILLYLVVNAVKYTEAGRVTLRERVDGDRMELIVADTGIGITPDLQTKLFLPFVQGDSSSTRRYGGIGLGLTLSQRLAEMMGGNLSLRSAGAGHGSTFIVSLPLAADMGRSTLF